MSRLLRHNVASRANATPGAEKGRRAASTALRPWSCAAIAQCAGEFDPSHSNVPWQTARRRNVCKRKNNARCAGHAPRSVRNIPRGGGCPAPQKFRAKFSK